MTGAIAVRAAVAIAGEGGVDDLRVDRAQRLVATAEAVHDAGTEGIDHHIGLGHHTLEGLNILRQAQVKGDRLLAAIDQAEQLRAHGAGIVPALGLLDLDDLGAELRQVERAEGARQQPGQIEHAQPVEQRILGRGLIGHSRHPWKRLPALA